MQVSQYNSPAQYTPIDTVTPIPFNELMQAGQLKQKDYEQGQQALGQAEDAYSNIHYIPNSVDEKYVKQFVIPRVQEIGQKYGNMDLSDPVIRRQMMSEFNTIDKGRLRGIQDSYTGWQQYNSGKQQLQLHNQLDPYFEDSSKGWDSSVHGTFSDMPSEYVDPIKTIKEQIFDPMKASYIKTLYHGNGNQTDLIGIDQQKIDQVTNSNIDDYLRTPTGIAAIRNIRRATGLGQDKLSDRDALRQAFNEAAAQHTYENRSNYTVNTGNSGKGEEIIPDFSGKSAIPKAPNVHIIPTTPTLGWDSKDIKSPNDIPNIDSYGYLRKPSKEPDLYSNPYDNGGNGFNIPGVATRGNVSGLLSLKGIFIKGQTEDNYKQQLQDYNNNQALLHQIKQQLPDSQKGLPDNILLYRYAQAHKGMNDLDYDQFLYNKKNKTEVSDQVTDDLNGRKLVGEDGKVYNSFSAFAKDVGIDNPKIPYNKKTNIKVVGYIPGLNMYSATVNYGNEEHRVYISPNSKEQQIFDPIEKIASVAHNGQMGYQPVVHTDDGSYKVYNGLVQDDKGQWKFKSMIYPTDESGSYQTGEPINFEDFQQKKASKLRSVKTKGRNSNSSSQSETEDDE